MANRVLIRRDSSDNWISANPILEIGEQGYETDTGKLKIGNGTDTWVDLSYQIGTVVPEDAVFTDTVYTLPEEVVKDNEANTFTASQRGAITALADDTVAIDFRPTNSYSVTLTADADITLATDGALGCTGQGGMFTVTTAEHITGWGAEFKWKTEPTDLNGVERFAYFIEAEDTIVIGRVA